MGRLKKNRTLRAIRRQTMERVQSELDAKDSWDKKHIGERVIEFLKEHIKDIPDWIALTGLTVMVHGVIVNTPGLVDATNNLMKGNFVALLGNLGTTIENLNPISITNLLGYIGIDANPEQLKTQFSMIENLNVWLASFLIAWVIVKYGGQLIGLLGDTVKSLTGMTKFFLLPAGAT